MLSFILITSISLLIALTIHEAAHAWVANYLGDPTARLMGRISLNPLVHLDPIGTVVFILTAFAGFPFGWGKPVVIDPYNLKDPRRDQALISLAGPASNIALASIISLVFRFIPTGIFQSVIVINVALAVFNLIPIHPLDGEKILLALLPKKEANQLGLFLGRYGFIILIFLIMFPVANGQSVISFVTSPIINFLLSVFLPGIRTI